MAERPHLRALCKARRGCRRIVDLANHELERRVVEDPDSIATKDLAVAGGIAADKVAKYEDSPCEVVTARR
ncbi:MAG TPA: hypothetical protein VKE73_01100 [Myxococcota bacterium]|nr:hypothetical protein [Myxococcota bacterium]